MPNPKLQNMEGVKLYSSYSFETNAHVKPEALVANSNLDIKIRQINGKSYRGYIEMVTTFIKISKHAKNKLNLWYFEFQYFRFVN